MTSYEYDPACGCGDRVTKITDALGRINQYQLDAAGRPIAFIDANNKQTSYTYDARNRTTKVTYADVTEQALPLVGDGEADVIRNTGRIPNVDRLGNPKDVYLTDEIYDYAEAAQSRLQLPNTPRYRVEIDPANVPNRTPTRTIALRPGNGVMVRTETEY